MRLETKVGTTDDEHLWGADGFAGRTYRQTPQSGRDIPRTSHALLEIEVAGYGKWPSSGNGDNAEHGFVWSFDGRTTTVEVIGTSGQSHRALAVNDSKIAVGHVTAGGVKNAYWWQSNTPTLLPDYGNYASAALAINNNLNPKIVGFAFDAAGKKRAILWQAQRSGLITSTTLTSARSNRRQPGAYSARATTRHRKSETDHTFEFPESLDTASGQFLLQDLFCFTQRVRYA